MRLECVTVRCIVVLVAASCSEPAVAPPVSPWVSVLGDSHVAELGVQFLADRAVFAVEGRFETPGGDRRVVTVDYQERAVAEPWVFDDLAVDVGRYIPLIEQDEVSVLARREGQLVAYRDDGGAPTTMTAGNMRQFASAPVAGGHVIVTLNTVDDLVAIYQPHGGPLSEVSIGIGTSTARVAAASIGDGVLLIAEGSELSGVTVTAAPFSVSPRNPVATLPCPITGLSVTPRSSGALVTVVCDSVLILGSVTAATTWQQHAVIDGRARTESVDVATLATGDVADVVIQTDSLTVVPVLIHYRVDLAGGNVEPGVVLTDGIQRFGRQSLAHEPSGGISIYALRTDPGSVRLVRAPLQTLLDNGIAEP
jgi:hypothetical protein